MQGVVLIDVILHEGRLLGGVLRLEDDVPAECFVNDAVAPEGWMWPPDAASRAAAAALVRSLVGALAAPPTLLVCPEEGSEAVREAAPLMPVRAIREDGARWVGTAPFSGHPAARLAASFEPGPWLARLRRGIALEAGSIREPPSPPKENGQGGGA